MRSLCFGLLFWTAFSIRDAAAESIAVPSRFPSGHPDAGLPQSKAPLPVYHVDPAHPLNRLHQFLFFTELSPEEINGMLPREVAAGTDRDRPWYFRKRTGSAADQRLFGGDIRISPLVNWSDENTAAFQKLAAELLSVPDLREAYGLTPLTELILQWDLLGVWWRLEQVEGTPPEVLDCLARLIQKTAQTGSELTALPDGWKNATTTFQGAPGTSMSTPYFSSDDLLSGENGWVELSRRSTKLFVSPQSLRASRVFVKLPPGADLSTWIAEQAAKLDPETSRPQSTIETAMVLSLIGISTELKPVATPVIDEIRFRTVYAGDQDVDLKQTTSQDGSTIWLYFLDRCQTLSQGSPQYRFISPDSQSLFLEYGSAKHASYAAQCTLCHRLTNSGNQAPGGVRSFSSIAAASVTNDPANRFRLAELQLEVVLDRLQERLKAGAKPLPAAEFEFRKLPHSVN